MFDGGVGLSSLREQFSDSLCSQWLSSAPHKQFQHLHRLTAVKSQDGIKGLNSIMCCYIPAHGNVRVFNFKKINVENNAVFCGSSYHFELPIIRMFIYVTYPMCLCYFVKHNRLSVFPVYPF